MSTNFQKKNTVRLLGEHFQTNSFEGLKRTVPISALLHHATSWEQMTIIQGSVWYLRKGMAFELERTGIKSQQLSW